MNKARTVAATTLASALLLTGCGYQGMLPEEIAQLQLTPHGDAGNWIHDEYEQGLSDTYSTTHGLCGVSGDLIVEARVEGGNESVAGVNLLDSEVVWEHPDATCSPNATMDGTVVVGNPIGATDQHWRLLDAANGEELQELDIRGHDVAQVMEADGVTVLIAAREVLFGVTADGTEWTQRLPGAVVYSALGDGHLGLSNFIDEWFTVLDVRTGEAVVPETSDTGFYLDFATDGYVLTPEEERGAATVYDFSGEPMGTADARAHSPFAPYTRRGITISLDDHRDAGPVLAFDASGTPVVFAGPNDAILTPDADITDIAPEPNRFVTTSVNGSLFVYGGNSGSDLIVADTHGNIVFSHEWPEVVFIFDGYLVLWSEHTVEVLIPNSYA